MERKVKQFVNTGTNQYLLLLVGMIVTNWRKNKNWTILASILFYFNLGNAMGNDIIPTTQQHVKNLNNNLLK